MNRFKQDLKKLIEQRKLTDQETYGFLTKVQEALGLSNEDVESIAKNHVRPNIKHYVFVADKSTVMEYSSINIPERLYLVPTHQGVLVDKADWSALFEEIDNYMSNVDVKKLKEVKSEDV